jgi:thiosulfate/3-mercaptopyruvate sulfurtransferase
MPGLLVTAEALEANPQWRIFDCRHNLANPEYGSQAYAQEHIPGAQFLHLDKDLSGPRSGLNGRHPLPDPDQFAARMSAGGVDATTQVVAYDNEGGMYAARLWWLLRWLGHDRVAVLDGGLAAWQQAGYPCTAAFPETSPAAFTAQLQHGMPVNSAEVLANLQRPANDPAKFQIIDARSPERFAGQNETLDPVGGHIPGAINRFFARNLDERGRFRPAAELRAEFASLLGDQSPQNVVQQCGSGVTACHNMLAMEIAGLAGSRLYPGSWSEWCADTSRPIATGS